MTDGVTGLLLAARQLSTAAQLWTSLEPTAINDPGTRTSTGMLRCKEMHLKEAAKTVPTRLQVDIASLLKACVESGELLRLEHGVQPGRCLNRPERDSLRTSVAPTQHGMLRAVAAGLGSMGMHRKGSTNVLS